MSSTKLVFVAKYARGLLSSNNNNTATIMLWFRALYIEISYLNLPIPLPIAITPRKIVRPGVLACQVFLWLTTRRNGYKFNIIKNNSLLPTASLCLEYLRIPTPEIQS